MKIWTVRPPRFVAGTTPLTIAHEVESETPRFSFGGLRRYAFIRLRLLPSDRSVIERDELTSMVPRVFVRATVEGIARALHLQMQIMRQEICFRFLLLLLRDHEVD